MLLQGSFKLTETKYIGDKGMVSRNENRMHPSCDSCGMNPDETSRDRFLVPKRSFGGYYDRPKLIGLYFA